MTPAERQAHADYWEDMTPTEAHAQGAIDKCHKMKDPTLEFDMPPENTRQYAEYMLGWNIKDSSEGYSVEAVLERVMADA